MGCGTGEFLHLAKELGYTVEGVELSKPAVAYAKFTYDVDVVDVSLEECNFENEFDVITLNHVLEHIPDQDLVLAAIHLALKPTGILHIEVPNIECWQPTLKRAAWGG